MGDEFLGEPFPVEGRIKCKSILSGYKLKTRTTNKQGVRPLFSPSYSFSFFVNTG